MDLLADEILTAWINPPSFLRLAEAGVAGWRRDRHADDKAGTTAPLDADGHQRPGVKRAVEAGLNSMPKTAWLTLRGISAISSRFAAIGRTNHVARLLHAAAFLQPGGV